MSTVELTYLVASIVCVTNEVRHEVEAEQNSCDAKQFAADSVKTYGSSDEAVNMRQQMKSSHEFELNKGLCRSESCRKPPKGLSAEVI
tara:strand:- start:111 stop:374 length:264 start_codon:yes stop_codon:yes gene_type:complete